MENKKLYEKFMEIITPYFENKENVSLESSLEEVGMDSFAAVRFLVDVECEFDVEFPDYLIGPETFETVGTIYACFCKVMNADMGGKDN